MLRGCQASHLSVKLDIWQEEVHGVKDLPASLPHTVESQPASGHFALIAAPSGERLTLAVCLHAVHHI